MTNLEAIRYLSNQDPDGDFVIGVEDNSSEIYDIFPEIVTTNFGYQYLKADFDGIIDPHENEENLL